MVEVVIAAEFPIGDDFEPDFFLQFDGRPNVPVLDLREGLVRELACVVG